MLTRKRTILGKIETTYGQDPTPSGASNAILVSNINPTPQETEMADRNLIRPHLGSSEQLPVAIHSMVEFDVEVAGSGTAGVAPAYGPLLRACAFAETILAAAVTGTAQAGGASVVTLAAGASAVDNFYRSLTIRTTGGTGSGQSRVIASYVGATKVATVSEAWTTPPDATTTYSIDAQVVYAPVSSGFESVTLHLNIDGVLHKMTGARGTVSFDLTAKKIPVMKFKFTGLYVAVIDGAAPTVVYSAYQKPVPVNGVNTTGLTLLGYAGAVLSQLSFDMANSVVFRSLVGAESVLITDRKPAGNITMEAVAVATKDWWTAVKNATTGALSVTQGTAAGNKVKFDSPAAQLTKPTYQDMDGVQMLQAGMVYVPGVNGNDEFTISVQ
ncbi:MAG: hypothetical protein KJ958_05525 [Gammaproteobacteria bacterium]|nr:hypothetical protein [Gammaproteobacteria bacterium]MBU1978614.1 hypothetical protein [Gammaproteobacteria bacterium]